MADRVGQQFGNYRLVALLGSGSCAEVYLGQHIRLELQAAIKVLHSRLTGQEAEYFQQEAQTIAKLAHPAIVRVFDFDVQDGVPFLVMDYAPGGSLRRRYPKGSVVPLPQIVSCVKQVATALQYAHDHQFIHRDVKPENMLVGRQQEVLLSDFGLVALAHSTGSLSAQAAVGTLPYMAPEQIEGHPRPASDQYALGVVVYEWLCGRRPFDGSVTEVMVKHLTTPPPVLQEHVPAISPEVEQVVLRALAKDPKHRFASVAAFGAALEQASQLAPSQPALPPMDRLITPPGPPSLPASALHAYATEGASPSQPAPAMGTLPLTSLPGLHQKPANIIVAPFHKPVVCPVLIGRIPDLATLHRLMNRAKSGKGGVALLSGEAGMGKSRLVTEGKTYAAAHEFVLLQGTCFPTDLSCPYAPLLDLLRSVLANRPGAKTEPSLQQVVQAFLPLLPDVVPLFPELAPTSTPRPLDPEQEKRRLFEALTHFLTSQTAKHPVLLVVEDLHWSDDTSLEFLHYLARRCLAHRLLLLLTYRSEEVHPSLRHFLAHLDRERLAQEIVLAGLTRREVEAMLRAIFSLPRSAQFELADVLFPLTEGNPFFIEEILTALVTAGEIFYVNGQWDRKELREVHIPRSVQDAVQQRTDRLSEEARQVVLLAAVAGRRFDFALLQELTHHDEPRLLLLLKELIATQLVVEESTEQFAFRHALTREALYAQLLARERKALHRRVAETMEHLSGSSLDAHVADLAYHYAEAGTWAKALEYGQHAGEQAQRLYAPRVAVEQFTRALQAAEQGSLPPPAPLYRLRGQAYETLGDFEYARADYETALQMARLASDLPAAWQALMDLGFLWAERDYAQTGAYYQQALELARHMTDPVLLAHSLNRLGNWHVNSQQPAEGLRYHQEALTLFQQAHDPQGIAETCDLLGMAYYTGGDLLQGTTSYRQAVALFQQLDDRKGLTSSLATLICACGSYDYEMLVPAPMTFAEALSLGEQALKLAREIGQRSAEAYALCTLGQCLGPQGDYARALEVVQEGLALAEQIGHRQWMTCSSWTLGALWLDLLALPEARASLEHALALAKEISSWYWIPLAAALLASVSVLQQDLTRAEALLTLGLGPDAPPQTAGERLVCCVRAELALARNEPALALDITDRLIASTANLTDEQVIPRLWKVRGEALAALHRETEAETALQAAQAGAMTQGRRPLLWRVAIDLGKLYQAQRRDEEAEQAFATAQELIEALAAYIPDPALHDHFLQQATALIPRTQPLSPRRAAKRAFAGLTQREREVAALIAQGKSNREIAEALVVNYRTIEAHVSNILSKLGLTSRAQIAVWATEKGLRKTEQQSF